MEKKGKIEFSLFSRIHGPLYGIISVLVGFTCNVVAYTFYPAYDFTRNAVSDLGTGPGGIFFNIGLILSGLLSIPFSIYIGKSFKINDKNQNLIRLSTGIAIIASFSMMMVGFFPAINNEIIYFLHGTWAYIAFLGGATYCFLFGFLMLKDDRFLNFQGYLGLLVALIFIWFLITFWAIAEWAVIVGIMIFTLTNALIMIYKKL